MDDVGDGGRSFHCQAQNNGGHSPDRCAENVRSLDFSGVSTLVTELCRDMPSEDPRDSSESETVKAGGRRGGFSRPVNGGRSHEQSSSVAMHSMQCWACGSISHLSGQYVDDAVRYLNFWKRQLGTE